MGGPSAPLEGETCTRTYSAPRTYLVEIIPMEHPLTPMAILSDNLPIDGTIIIALLDSTIAIPNLHSPLRVSGSFGNQMASLH